MPSDDRGAHSNVRSAMKPSERFAYVPIVDRKKLRLADRKRVIVWPLVSVEEWDVAKQMPRTQSVPPGGLVVLPDIQNWGWHEYGMRVGIWRLLETFDKYGIKPTLTLNAKVCETRPRLAHALLDAGWEFAAHGYEQMHISKVQDQREMMRHSVEVLKKFTGRRPAGWLGPGRGQTFATMDHIADAGFRWFSDWVMDDLPFWAETLYGPILSLPYTAELNDVPVMVGAQHESDVMLKRTRDIYKTLHRDAESADSVRIMAFGVHPFVSGASHRIGYFDEMLRFLRDKDDVTFMKGEQIYDWYSAQVAPGNGATGQSPEISTL